MAHITNIAFLTKSFTVSLAYRPERMDASIDHDQCVNKDVQNPCLTTIFCGQHEFSVSTLEQNLSTFEFRLAARLLVAKAEIHLLHVCAVQIFRVTICRLLGLLWPPWVGVLWYFLNMLSRPFASTNSTDKASKKNDKFIMLTLNKTIQSISSVISTILQHFFQQAVRNNNITP